MACTQNEDDNKIGHETTKLKVNNSRNEVNDLKNEVKDLKNNEDDLNNELDDLRNTDKEGDLENLEALLKSCGLYYHHFIYVTKEDVENLRHHEMALMEKLKESPYATEFEPDPSSRSFFSDIEKNMKTNDRLLLVSVALPYDSHLDQSWRNRGVIDASSWSYDYHLILKTKMNGAMRKVATTFNKKIIKEGYFVDTSNYIDRELARLCGMGKYGKNHMLIHPDLGTQFHIGHFYFVIESHKGHPRKVLEIDDGLLYEGCTNCNKCVNACPAQICGQVQMNRLKCISYLTQTKKPLEEVEMKRIGNRLYGCDICQRVCPANRDHKPAPEYIDYWSTEGFKGIDLIEVLGLSQRAFKRKYQNTGFAWRGLKILKRNALIAVGNSEDPVLITALNDFEALKDDDYLAKYYLYARKRIERD